MITLAIDAMGGDHAPHFVLEGLTLAAERHVHLQFILFGNESMLKPLVPEMLKSRVSFVHTDDVITADTKPSLVLRGFKKSSMRLAIESAATKQTDGVVSAGNTGAYMVLSRLLLKTLPGIDRPAIVSLVPTLRGESVMLDLGANAECTADNLVQFAIMGSSFARHALGLHHPRVGLLNVGSEDLKGSAIVKEAFQILKEDKILSHFHGFVEGDDICKGTVDVIVTDGFTGNVALKTGEGVMQLWQTFLKKGFQNSWLAKIGYLFVKPMLNHIKLQLDPRRYNGALFIGLNGVAVKSHGGTDALGFASAVTVAYDMITSKTNHHICHELQHRAQTYSTLPAASALNHP